MNQIISNPVQTKVVCLSAFSTSYHDETGKGLSSLVLSWDVFLHFFLSNCNTVHHSDLAGIVEILWHYWVHAVRVQRGQNTSYFKQIVLCYFTSDHHLAKVFMPEQSNVILARSSTLFTHIHAYKLHQCSEPVHCFLRAGSEILVYHHPVVRQAHYKHWPLNYYISVGWIVI